MIRLGLTPLAGDTEEERDITGLESSFFIEYLLDFFQKLSESILRHLFKFVLNIDV